MQNTIRKFIIKEKEEKGVFLIFQTRKMAVQNLYFSRTRTVKKGKQRTMEKERKKKAKKIREKRKRAKRIRKTTKRKKMTKRKAVTTLLTKVGKLLNHHLLEISKMLAKITLL